MTVLADGEDVRIVVADNGIGLHLLKRLLDLHEEQVTVASDGPGKGSTFTIRLPRAMPVDDAAASSDGDHHGNGKGLNILTVDDSRGSADMLSMLMNYRGHNASIVTTGGEALKMAQLTPDMSGDEVARALRQLPALAGTRLVALTGRTTDQIKEAPTSMPISPNRRRWND